ncbi:hypothetical protein HHL10_00795 [Azohydromonas sp. G-1-1-14]|uniref:Uncharacterized protein n=1 Tax=Azohydromonas caseinilytica TaxID=2728836 RepID=A0A848F4I7_9BURK|nr:hypothetical protein [Azohydromonas caseinilytica]
MLFFIRIVQEKHSALLSSVDALLRALVGEDGNLKLVSAKAVMTAATDLLAILSGGDVPAWLGNVIVCARNFGTRQWSAGELLVNLIDVKREIESHKWKFDETSENAFDFDRTFDQCRKQSKIPDLFNEISKLLEDIRGSNEIDSISMLKALGKVSATLKKSRDGSYFALNGAWELLLGSLNNYMWNELVKLPGLGAPLEALAKGIQEVDREMSKLHKQVHDEMARTVGTEVKALSHKPLFSFVEYGRNGRLLPDAGSPKLQVLSA